LLVKRDDQPVRLGVVVILRHVGDVAALHGAGRDGMRVPLLYMLLPMVDEAGQVRMLCSVLGPALASSARAKAKDVPRKRLPAHGLVIASIAMLAQDPGVGVDQIAHPLAVSRSV
jgi:hypothetical protein